MSHYLPLIARVLDQSERRVLHGQAVPAGEKLVSLFEPHADIIVKGARDVQYGHKLNLVTGKSGLILDVVIEAGNPADAERFLPMLDRHIARCGTPPRQMAADGGYASRDNLDQAKARGVTDVAFHKKRGLAVADMTKSRLGLPQTAQLPRRHRGRHLLLQARLRRRHAAPGAASTTSRRTSGPRWWPTTWCCSPASNRHSPRRRRQHRRPTGQTRLACRCTPTESSEIRRYLSAKRRLAPSPLNPPLSSTPLKNMRLWTGTS